MNGKLYNRDQIVDLLGINRETLRELEREGLPVYPFSQKMKCYDLELIHIWLRANKLQSISSEGKKRA